MKTPIEPSDIRAGDTVERHWMGTVMTMPVRRLSSKGGLAYSSEGYCMGLSGDDGETFYLIDRPAPPVELPTEPTLGWADGEIRVWRADDLMLRSVGSPATLREHVTAFIPATAVPTDALDVLREFVANSEHSRLIGDFLAAVDEANR